MQYLEDEAVDENGIWLSDRITEVPTDEDLWKADPILDISPLKRAHIYCQWRGYGEPLFTFSLIHQCRDAYHDLNCLLCHVKPFSCALTKSRWQCGQIKAPSNL